MAQEKTAIVVQSKMGSQAIVQCYSGYIYADRPESFLWQGNTYQVEKIEKAWQEPGERHFRVRTEGHKPFEICYHELEDEWTVIELAQGYL